VGESGDTKGALAGLRVIDLCRNVAGPYAAKLLADNGAEVIKLEPPGGDPSRHFGPFPGGEPHPERSGLFLHLNRGKQSLVVDPASEEGAATISAFAEKADLLLEDQRPGDAAKWGWSYDALARMNPALVVTSITPFGQTGPYRDYLGSEITLQALGGAMYTNGHQDQEPLKLAGHFAHYHAGLMATVASLMALRRASKTGHGDWIDLSIHECQAACRDRQCVYLTIAGYTGMSVGRLRAAAARMGAGVRPCADGYVNIMGAANRLPRLLSVIGREDLSSHPGLMAPAGTVPPDLFEAVEGAYAKWLAPQHKADVVGEAQRAGLLAGAVNTIGDVMADPHYQSRNVWQDIEHPEAGLLRYPGRPFVFSHSTQPSPKRAPLLDEHRVVAEGAWSARPRSAPSAEAPSVLPMEGLRVAEITVVWAGPHVTQLMGEWGADVVRVEPANKPQPYTRGMEDVPTTAQASALVKQGIPTRLMGNDPGMDPWNRNAAFNSHARNKRSMACDIMSEEGREALFRLVEHCDVLVENNVPQTMDKAGITWEVLSAINPRLIWLRMPAFALEGPYRNYRAFGLHVEAMVGHTHLRGYPGQSPERLSESLASDGIAGVQGAVAVLMALRHREETGHGQLIEMPLTEGFLPTLGEFIMDHSMNGHDSPTQGNRHPLHAPHNVYACEGDDDWIAIDVATDAQFAALCDVLDVTELASDPRFAGADDRRQHLHALDAAIGDKTRAVDKNVLFHALQARGVCATPVKKAVEVLADDHLEDRGFFEMLPTSDDATPYPYPGLSFRMQRTPNQLRTGPVRLGQHNRELYCDLLGYSPEQLADLEARGLVASRYPETVWSSKET
jgi:crotonobetainyl-CoA:carnitine CoA-transferase CaiB-like acyl-CoA transferase